MRRSLLAVVLAPVLVLALGLGAGPAGAADVLEYGGAPDVGQPPQTARIAGAAPSSTGGGYWTVGPDGAVAAFGDARHVGDAARVPLNRPIVGMASTPTGGGYWLVSSDGGIFTYGDARFFGSTGNRRLNSPIVGLTTTPTGAGYWLVAGDGGIFSFGDARFFGSTGAMRLNQPVVGMAATPTGAGYWLVSRDGGIFSFGDALFHGSAGNLRLTAPVVAMSATAAGYRLVSADGGVFTYGDARFAGSAASECTDPIVAIVPSSAGGYWIVGSPLPRPAPPPGTHPLDVLAAESTEVQATLSARQRCQPGGGGGRAVPLSAPLRGGRNNGGFGPRTHPIYRRAQLHTGVDLVGGDGVVRAAADGVVVSVENRAGYGNAVVIDHGNSVATLSAHLARADVVAGQLVTRGQPLGPVGATGFATGPHLHFEVRSRGVPVNPAGLV